MKKFREFLTAFRPDFVNLSQSESVEEITVANLVVTGSIHEEGKTLCPSRFSNYGSRVTLWTKGERVESASGCKEQAQTKLTGTSQSAAIATNYLARQWTQGADPAKALAALPRVKCKETELIVLK